MPYGAKGDVNCGSAVNFPVVPCIEYVDTVLPPLFDTKSQKFPSRVPSECSVKATGFAPVDTVPPAPVIAVNSPVTWLSV